jgi:hypothetical protein
MKPVDIARLFEIIATQLDLQSGSDRASPAQAPAPIDVTEVALPDGETLRHLIRHCEIGYLRGLRETLAAVAAEGEAMLPFVDHMSRYVEAIDLRGLMAELERVSEVVP